MSRPICFDETGIRVLNADVFDESKKMVDQCKLFTDSHILHKPHPDVLQSSATFRIECARWWVRWMLRRRTSNLRR